MPRNAQCLTVPSLWIHAVRNAKLHQHRGAKVEVMTFGGLWGINPAPWNPTLCRVLQKQNLGNPNSFPTRLPKTNILDVLKVILLLFTMGFITIKPPFLRNIFGTFSKHQTYANPRHRTCKDEFLDDSDSPFGNRHVQVPAVSCFRCVHPRNLTWNLKRSP